MKKKFTISIILILAMLGIFVVVRTLCKPADASIEGTVLEKDETTFMLETDTIDQIVCDWPKNYDTSHIPSGNIPFAVHAFQSHLKFHQ